MPKLVIKPEKLVKILTKYYGFYPDHQSGSHLILLHEDGNMAVVPMHGTELRQGTLHSILKQANLTKEDILKYA
ncbi:MAG: type II toxin-antitoxin system HicA family toxin [Candidatus Micrarchaeota archaeon]|nr:type II toxin-antitoxin system HicA family toxin [Candidatus Micrarchaeota archaeon]